MAIIVEDGTGKTDSNSYATIAVADLYFQGRLHSTVWDNADVSIKEQALVWATQLLDSLVDWEGGKTSETQALRFPREGLYDLDENEYEDDEIPTWLVNATAEFAMSLISTDRMADAGGSGLEKVKVGPIDIKFDKADDPDQIPASVWALIRQWGERYSDQLKLTRM